MHNNNEFLWSIFGFLKIFMSEFTGDDIGLAANVCNAFFPTPTDVGLCLTKDLDIKTIVKSNDLFDYLLEPEIQSRPPGLKIEGGTYWTESTLILYTEAGNSLR